MFCSLREKHCVSIIPVITLSALNLQLLGKTSRSVPPPFYSLLYMHLPCNVQQWRVSVFVASFYPSLTALTDAYPLKMTPTKTGQKQYTCACCRQKPFPINSCAIDAKYIRYPPGAVHTRQGFPFFCRRHQPARSQYLVTFCQQPIAAAQRTPPAPEGITPFLRGA